MSAAGAPLAHPRLRAAGVLAAGPALLGASLAAGRLGAVCPSRVLGLDCPLCGGTRATLALLDGRFLDALDQNLAATLVVLPALATLSLLAAARLLTGAPSAPVRRHTNALAWAVFVLVAGFGVLRNLPLGWNEWLGSGLQL